MKFCREATDAHQTAPLHAVNDGLSDNSAPTIKALLTGTVPLDTRCVDLDRRRAVTDQNCRLRHNRSGDPEFTSLLWFDTT
jgi:hypothetical protein